jgi:hypothetical protein
MKDKAQADLSGGSDVGELDGAFCAVSIDSAINKKIAITSEAMSRVQSPDDDLNDLDSLFAALEQNIKGS